MNITSYIRAAYPGIAIITSEEQRATRLIIDIGKELGYHVYSWTLTQGMFDVVSGGKLNTNTEGNPIAPLESTASLPEKSIVILNDFHPFIHSGDPTVLRKVKDTLVLCEQTRRTLIFLGCAMNLPKELEKEIVIESMPLPTKAELQDVLDGIATSAGVTLNGEREEILRAASGLTTIEAKNAFSRAYIESGKQSIPPHIVAEEKCQAVNKCGLLEIVRSHITLDQVGGLERLKHYLMSIKDNFTDEAVDFGLEPPAPLFVVGQAGTGKTLVSFCITPIFHIPTLRLDASKLMASHVGETEANWRSVVQVVQAIAPCGLHIDEIDGTVGSVDTSGHTDGGVKAGLVKQMLQDIQRMQSEKVPVLFYFTANDIEGCPDPLIDRCDVWSVDLPHLGERKAIWKIQIEKRKRDSSKFDLVKLAQETEGFSGRQIERCWKKAMERAFGDGRREPTTDDALVICGSTMPTSKTMAEMIERRRKRLEGRAQPASEPPALEKMVVRKFD